MKSIVKAIGFNGFSRGGTLIRVDINGDRIVRIRPLKYDWKYKPEDVPTFEFKAHNGTFRTPIKELTITLYLNV